MRRILVCILLLSSVCLAQSNTLVEKSCPAGYEPAGLNTYNPTTGKYRENFCVKPSDGSTLLQPTSIGMVVFTTDFPGNDLGTQIKEAIAYLGSSGGTILIPRGTYTLSVTVPITQPNICIKGAGAQATEILSTVNGDAFYPDIGGVDSTSPLQNGCMVGFTLVGNADNSAVGIHLSDTTGYVFRDIAVKDFTGSSGKGFYLDNELAWTERTVFDHVTTQNNTFDYYFYKGVSTSSSFGYTSWIASHLTVNNNQTGIYVASGADLYHSSLNFKANLQPFTNTNSSTLIDIAGSMVQDTCNILGEFTGSTTGSGGHNYGINNETIIPVECSGVLDVAGSINNGPVFVGHSNSDGSTGTLFNSLPDGTIAWEITTDRVDTGLGNTHPFFGLYESNANSKAGFVMDFHNCITGDNRCGFRLFRSSGSSSGFLTTATQFGEWGADGTISTDNTIASDTSLKTGGNAVSAAIKLKNSAGEFRLVVGCSSATANDACLYDTTTNHFPWEVNSVDQTTFNYWTTFQNGASIINGGVISSNNLQPTATQTTITGTTAGSAICTQPFQGSSYEKVICYLNGYENTTATSQTYTFPTPFSHVPVLLHDDAGGSGLSATTLSLPVSMGAVKTGWIIVEGF